MTSSLKMPSCNKPLPLELKEDTDIILGGRGKKTSSATIKFYVSARKEIGNIGNNRQSKSVDIIAHRLYDDCVQGGRFVSKNENDSRWYELAEDKCIIKIKRVVTDMWPREDKKRAKAKNMRIQLPPAPTQGNFHTTPIGGIYNNNNTTHQLMSQQQDFAAASFHLERCLEILTPYLPLQQIPLQNNVVHNSIEQQLCDFEPLPVGTHHQDPDSVINDWLENSDLLNSDG